LYLITKEQLYISVCDVDSNSNSNGDSNNVNSISLPSECSCGSGHRLKRTFSNPLEPSFCQFCMCWWSSLCVSPL